MDNDSDVDPHGDDNSDSGDSASSADPTSSAGSADSADSAGAHERLDAPVPPDPPESIGDDDVVVQPPTLYARIADTCSALIDAVAEVEKLEARQAAWKVEFIDRARTLAIANEEGVADCALPESVGPTPGNGHPQSKEQRQDLALRSFVAELACILRISESMAGDMVGDSFELTHRLPLTLAALRDGEISYRHAQQLVDQISTLSDAAAAELEEKALPFAKTMTVARFRHKTRMLRERVFPESAVDRCIQSVRDRRLDVIPAPDGMAWLNLFTTAPLAEALFSTVRKQSMRLQSPGDPRTLPQLDADVAVGAIFESFTGEFSLPDPTGSRIFGTGLGTARYDVEPLADAESPVGAVTTAATFQIDRFPVTGPGGDPIEAFRKLVPTVMVTVPVLTLLGKSDEPGNLDGYGPIDPQTARDLASQATEFSRILTHPESGVALSLGKTKYTPSKAMRRFLRYRDGYCRFPGCSRRAVSCDIDHTDPFESGGCTDIDNLASLCPRHHKMKHETLWQVRQLRDGVLKWTSPQGREYVTSPENPVRGPVPSAKPRRGNTAPDPDTGLEVGESGISTDAGLRVDDTGTRTDAGLEIDDTETSSGAGGSGAGGSGDPQAPNTPPF